RTRGRTEACRRPARGAGRPGSSAERDPAGPEPDARARDRRPSSSASHRRPARGAAHGAADGSGGPLTRLPVERVVPAPAAALLELDAVGRVPLRLLRLVVPPLAVRAGERDLVSYSGCHVVCLALSLSVREKVAAGGLEPPTRGL